MQLLLPSLTNMRVRYEVNAIGLPLCSCWWCLLYQSVSMGKSRHDSTSLFDSVKAHRNVFTVSLYTRSVWGVSSRDKGCISLYFSTHYNIYFNINLIISINYSQHSYLITYTKFAMAIITCTSSCMRIN